MNDQINTVDTTTVTNDETGTLEAAVLPTQVATLPDKKRGTDRGERGRGRGGRRGGGRREERPRSEFDQKTLSVRRVARVMAGGRRFNFSVAIVIGDRKGGVGVGTGKAADTALAIDKALRDAKKNLLRLKLTKDMMLPHDVSAKYAASVVSIYPARGHGLVAGSSVRTVLELAGVRDVTAKILSRSKNQLNNARAAMKALSTLVR